VIVIEKCGGIGIVTFVSHEINEIIFVNFFFLDSHNHYFL